MKRFLMVWLGLGGVALASEMDAFIAMSKERHGEFGGRAATFLVEHMPEEDRDSMQAEELVENLDLAMAAREKFPWAKGVPEERFWNDVLPYAVFDETREPWRKKFLELAGPMVDEVATASEAAQILNRDFFDLIKVHYHTGRKRPNQSPGESIAQGRATCTGLSIILVDACRAVGIPARAVGTPMWSSGRGNHTWVEIWDGEWHFTGADEHVAEGLDRGWFVGDAGKAQADQPMHAIYATSWSGATKFPLAWSQAVVRGENVTARYAVAGDEKSLLGVRVMDGEGRLAVKGRLKEEGGEVLAEFETRAGRADRNDLPRLEVRPGASCRLEFLIDGKWWKTEVFTAEAGDATKDVRVAELEQVLVTREVAERIRQRVFEELVAERREAMSKELEAKEIVIGEKKLKWLEKRFGEAPAGKRSLWISMHGGGGAPAKMNDGQWRNQIRLYQPEEGFYLAPRAPTDTWNLWHEGHIDPMFGRLIEDYVALRGVSPDRVYLMGYSAGGDGVWQLAPRMADRYAAAAMMAGHPNEASLLGLRNLPFAIFMGGEDAAYDRNRIAAERVEQLAELRKGDPEGYEHFSRIYEGLGHRMNGKDAEALPWMAGFSRNPWPKKIVWFQDDVVHERFYWLKLPPGVARKGQKIEASVEGQVIRLVGDVPKGTQVLLADELLDLDQPISLIVNGKQGDAVTVERSEERVREAMEERLDPRATPTAVMRVE